jgi:hypothetical protein
MGPVEIIERSELLQYLADLSSAKLALVSNQPLKSDVVLARKRIKGVCEGLGKYCFEPSTKEKI